jgi:hypothetical protein
MEKFGKQLGRLGGFKELFALCSIVNWFVLIGGNSDCVFPSLHQVSKF